MRATCSMGRARFQAFRTSTVCSHLAGKGRSMTPKQAEEHNRAFAAAWQLVEQELLVHGLGHPVSVERAVQLKLERALELFARVLEINPANWSAMWFLGKIYQRLGDYSTAFMWFCRAYRVSSSQPDVAREASICAMDLGLSEDAVSYARAAVQGKPSDNGLVANLALALLLACRLSEARTAIDKATLVDPSDAVSQTVKQMIEHFVASHERPPNTTSALKNYWKKHMCAKGRRRGEEDIPLLG